MNNLFFVFSLLFVLSCSSEKNFQQIFSHQNIKNQAIIGGIDASTAHPFSRFVVALYDKKNRYICTGSLISENVILTAAHCIETEATNITVIFDLDFFAYDSNNLKLLRTANVIKIHPGYKKNNTSDFDWNDLALVQFTGGLPEGFSPVQILKDSEQLKRDLTVQIAGFGATRVEFEEIISKKDKKFKQDLASGNIVCYDKQFNQCYAVHFLGSDRLRFTEAQIEGFTEKEIRMYEAHGKGTCVGDSGGPLLFQAQDSLKLIGVTSRGSLFCDGPAIYTNATQYNNWIEQAVNELH